MAKLSRQHHDLAALVCVMRNQIGNKSDHFRTKSSDPPVARQCTTQDCAQCVPAVLQRAQRLRRPYGRPIQLVGYVDGPGCLQPHRSHIVHESHDRSGVAPFALWGLAFQTAGGR
jgi:hypothetical protein